MLDGPLRPSIPLAKLSGLLLEISAISLRCSDFPVLGKVGKWGIAFRGGGVGEEGGSWKRRGGVLQRPHGPEHSSTNKPIDRRVDVVILLFCPEAFVGAFVNRGQVTGGSWSTPYGHGISSVLPLHRDTHPHVITNECWNKYRRMKLSCMV